MEANPLGSGRADPEDATEACPRVSQSLNRTQISTAPTTLEDTRQIFMSLIFQNDKPSVALLPDLKSQPYLQVLLQEAMPAQALYHPKAKVSCLGEETFQNLPEAKILTRNKTPSPICRGTNDLVLQELDVMTLQVCTGDHYQTQVFRIIRGLQEDVILVMDSLHQHGLTYDPAT